MREKYRDHIAIFTDGSKAGERVASAATAEGHMFVRRLPDRSSIFSAELIAISLALSYISKSNNTRFIIFSDSLSSLQAFSNFDFKNPLLNEIINLFLTLRGKTIIMAWIPSHIGIKGNEEVDQLAKSALDLPPGNISVPHTDFKGTIKSFIKNKWQLFWDQQNFNKLHSLKPILGEWAPSCRSSRREEMVLARIRIGHTHLTHSFLLKGEPVPDCTTCQEPLTVEHILLHCTAYNHIRPTFFNCTNMKDLFDKTDPINLINYIKAIGLFYKL